MAEKASDNYAVRLLTQRLGGVRSEIEALSERLNEDLQKREELIGFIGELQIQEQDLTQALERLQR